MHLRVHHVVFLAVLAMNGSIQAHDTDSQTGPLGKVSLPHQLRSEGAGGLRARRGDAALVLVLGRGEGLPRRAERRPAVRDRHLGHRVDPDVESAGRTGRIAQGRRAGAGGDRPGTPDRREDRARARLHRGRRRLLRGLREPSRDGRARSSRAKAYEALAAALSRRRRGADLLRALPRRHAVAGRPDLRGVPQGGRDPREAVREASRPSRASRTT